jgi:hypothetical protein
LRNLRCYQYIALSFNPAANVIKLFTVLSYEFL